MSPEAVITVKVADAPEVQAALREAARALEDVTAERDQYRAALQRIAEPLHDGTAPASWVDMARTAREALDGTS